MLQELHIKSESATECCLGFSFSPESPGVPQFPVGLWFEACVPEFFHVEVDVEVFSGGPSGFLSELNRIKRKEVFMLRNIILTSFSLLAHISFGFLRFLHIRSVASDGDYFLLTTSGTLFLLILPSIDLRCRWTLLFLAALLLHSFLSIFATINLSVDIAGVDELAGGK